MDSYRKTRNSPWNELYSEIRLFFPQTEEPRIKASTDEQTIDFLDTVRTETDRFATDLIGHWLYRAYRERVKNRWTSSFID